MLNRQQNKGHLMPLNKKIIIILIILSSKAAQQILNYRNSSREPWGKEDSFRAVRCQGLLGILCAQNGYIGVQCAVQTGASNMCGCAFVAVHILSNLTQPQTTLSMPKLWVFCKKLNSSVEIFIIYWCSTKHNIMQKITKQKYKFKDQTRKKLSYFSYFSCQK